MAGFSDYLILSDQLAAHQAENYHSLVEEAEGVLQILHTSDPTKPGDTLVSVRGPGEAAALIVDAAAYEEIRPFGNYADGTATGELLFNYYDGWPVRLFDNGKAYPNENEPFDAECRHHYFDTPATPQASGWGFRMELVGDYAERDPTARAIGVYSDPGCTQYLWKTGAFSLGPSLWQVDDEGQPLTVYYTNSWDGDRPAEKKDWHIAFLLGSVQEGHQTLPADQDAIRYLFWEATQGEQIEEPQPWDSGRLYNTGEQCTHAGETWESTMDGNHWEPGVVHSVWIVVE